MFQIDRQVCQQGNLSGMLLTDLIPCLISREPEHLFIAHGLSVTDHTPTLQTDAIKEGCLPAVLLIYIKWNCTLFGQVIRNYYVIN